MISNRARKYVRPGFALIVFAALALDRIDAKTNLVWQAEAGFRFAALPVPKSGRAGFTLVQPNETGITFNNRLANASVAKNRLLEIGSGVALGNIDCDGWVDIYFCRLEGDNVLYRNLGDWRFENVTTAAGVGCANQFSTGCVFADIDGDGDLDLLVNSLGGGTRAFLNDGKGRFTEITDTLLVHRFGATSLALADVDEDGRADLLVTQNGSATKLFHNLREKPGLRVRLTGPPHNPRGIGSIIRVMAGNRFGPAREIHAGSGYWSQDSTTPVLCSSATPQKVWIRWPGGTITEAEAPAGSHVLEARFDRK